MRIVAFAASSSRDSINKALVTHAGERLVAEHLPEATLEVLDLNDYEMPLYSIDRERADGIPDEAHRFLAALGAADGLLVSFAEHNGSYSAAFKNLFDWASRAEKNVWQGKPLLFLSTSPGGRGGQSVLETAVGGAPRFGGELVGSLAVPRFGASFSRETGALVDEALSAALGEQLVALATAVQG